MTPIKMTYGLPFTEIKIIYRGNIITLDNILIDTGSGGTILKMDKVSDFGLKIEPDDFVESITGIGGSELVYLKEVHEIWLGNLHLSKFQVEIGIMDYGFNINGIVGMDFLRMTHSIIDLDTLQIRSATLGKDC
jgi:hypothetical protein